MSYEKSFKEEAVCLSDEIGVKKAAEQLGVPYYTLADWRQQRKRTAPRLMSAAGTSACRLTRRSSGSTSWKKRTASFSVQMRSCRRHSIFRKKPEEVRARLRYAFAEERVGKWPVTALCRALELSESGYYRYLKRKGKPSRDELLSGEMQKILDESPYNDNYGARRMQLALAQRGVSCGLRRLTRLMREHGWLHERRRRPKGLTKPDPQAMAAENLLHQDFSADRPWQKLLTDITQIQCADGKLYISPIMDCFNGEILSLCMAGNMRKELCIETLKAAVGRFPIRGAILHSDRGSQYTSAAFRQGLKNCGVIQSLSGVAHCYDNARMESFFATLKKELLYRIPTYRMAMGEVKTMVFRYVFIYYNQYRVYTSNPGGLSPAAFRISAIGYAA